MKMYEGTAPCHGCGRTGEEVPRRNKDSLCYECQQALIIGQTIVKERNLERKYYRMDDLRLVDMTWYTIPLPEISQAVIELLRTFSQFDRTHANYKDSYEQSLLAGSIDAVTSKDTFVLPDVTFKAAKRLCNLLKESCWTLKKGRDEYQNELNEQLRQQKNDIYNEGVAYGRNLLAQLNRGEISVNDFDKPVMKF